MSEPVTHKLEVPGAVRLHSTSARASPGPTGARDDRVADGRRQLRDARDALPRSHGRHL